MTKNQKLMLTLVVGMSTGKIHPQDLTLMLVTETPQTTSDICRDTKIPVAQVTIRLAAGERVKWFTRERRRKGSNVYSVWTRTALAETLLAEAETVWLSLIRSVCPKAPCSHH